MFYPGLRRACDIGFSIVLLCYKAMAFCHFLAFFQLLNRLTERTEFWCAISIWYIDYSDNGYDVLN